MLFNSFVYVRSIDVSHANTEILNKSNYARKCHSDRLKFAAIETIACIHSDMLQIYEFTIDVLNVMKLLN